MKSTVNLSDFRDAFQIRKDQFSYEGLESLFDYLEEYGEGTGEELEFNVIALCCDYCEYKNLAEFQEAYNAEDYQSMEDIEEHTTVIEIDQWAFIIQQF